MDLGASTYEVYVYGLDRTFMRVFCVDGLNYGVRMVHVAVDDRYCRVTDLDHVVSIPHLVTHVNDVSDLIREWPRGPYIGKPSVLDAVTNFFLEYEKDGFFGVAVRRDERFTNAPVSQRALELA